MNLWRVGWIMYNTDKMYKNYTIGNPEEPILGLAGITFSFWSEDTAKAFVKQLEDAGITKDPPIFCDEIIKHVS